MATLRDFWLDRRNRLIADPRFQKWAAQSVFTRKIAKNRARELFDLCAGFVYSQVLSACVNLDIFERLRTGPRLLDELAADIALEPPRAQRLLDAAVSLALLDRRADNRYALGRHGAALLANPGITAMIRHHSLLYADLADPIALLRDPRRETELASFWRYARTADSASLQDQQVADYTTLMSASQGLVANDILDSYDFTQHRLHLDIGGGDGTFAERAAMRAPLLQTIVFDLPAVAARAMARFERSGLSGRSRAIGGDFFHNPLPKGADLITFVRVLHDHDDEKVLIVLKAAFDALAPGATLLIAEPLSGVRGAEAMADAYFGFYLMAMGSGHARCFKDIAVLLQRAGFSSIRQLRTPQPIQMSLITAQR